MLPDAGVFRFGFSAFVEAAFAGEATVAFFAFISAFLSACLRLLDGSKGSDSRSDESEDELELRCGLEDMAIINPEFPNG